MVPENEKLLITKVDERGGKLTYDYRSDPVKDMITASEYYQMKKLVGDHPKSKWLTSVLWFLSELALK